MKNTFFKKLVALSLAVLMLVGSGIGADLAGIDLAGLVGIKASAEDPKNEVLYDDATGLYFTVDDSATIVGTEPSVLVNSEYFDGGIYTLPNQVKQTKVVNGQTLEYIYNVTKVNHFAFLNSKDDITKIIIPNTFNELTLKSGAFAGMDNLTEFALNQPDVVTEGPLFELVSKYDFDIPHEGDAITLDADDTRLLRIVQTYLGTDSGFDGTLKSLSYEQRELLNNALANTDSWEYKDLTDNRVKDEQGNPTGEVDSTISINDRIVSTKDVVNNCFPIRDNYGVLQLNDDETLAGVRFYSAAASGGVNSDEASLDLPFEENIIKLTSINTVSKEDIDAWKYEAYIYTNDLNSDSVVTGDDTKIGAYREVNENGKIKWVEVPYAIVSLKFEEVAEVSVENIVDGNGSQSKASTIVLHKSPVSNITLGAEITAIPDYFFYDTDVENVNLSNVKKIGKFAFVDCDRLTSVDLNNVSEIGEYAFAACDGLTEVTIPEGMESIGNSAFMLCDNLATVTYNATNCSVDNTPFTNSGVSTMVFGKDVTTIPSNIGAGVATLNTVVFLADTSSLAISDGAFSGSGSINEIQLIDEDKWNDVEVGPNNGSIKAKNTEISTHTHNYNITKTYEPTCSEEGYTVDICMCGEECTESGKGRRDYTDKLPHTYAESPDRIVKVSCESEGYELFVCKFCGHQDKRNVQAALGHDYSDSVTYPATCTEPERVVGTCSRCHNVVTTEGSPALGHDFGEYIYNNNATTRNDGTETARCSRCGVVDERTVPGTRIVDHLAIAAMTNGAEKTVEYGSKTVVFSKAFNVPSNYHLGIFVDGKLVAEGNNEEVTYTVDKITEDTTFTTFILDANGNIATETPRKIDKAKVNNNFFSRIIAFFKGLFGLLPTVYFGK